MDFTTRWLLVLGLGTVMFAISLFVLRVPFRTIIILFIIGLSVVTLWLYVDKRSSQQKRISDITAQACVCPICKHNEAKMCLGQKCACCLVMKGSTVIGHSINPLQ